MDRGDRIRAVLLGRFQRIGAGGEQRLPDGRRALGRPYTEPRAPPPQLDEAVVLEVVIGDEGIGTVGVTIPA